MSKRSSNKTEVRAKKYLGQHFLEDLTAARRIADAVTSDHTKHVLEVGPGMGVLTQYLLPRTDISLAVAEIDTESVDYLRRHYPQLAIIEGDFLNIDLQSDYPEGVNIIGNFPYNISSQIFFRVLDFRDAVPQVVGMLQKEVAVRIAHPPGGKEYGILSVLLQAYYDIEYLFEVAPTAFNPPPKVQSAVIRLVRNSVQSLGCDEVLFKKIVKATFNQRRKTMRNSLRAAFPTLAEGAVHPYFGLRPEVLSVAQFVELTLWMTEQLAQSVAIDNITD